MDGHSLIDLENRNETKTLPHGETQHITRVACRYSKFLTMAVVVVISVTGLRH